MFHVFLALTIASQCPAGPAAPAVQVSEQGAMLVHLRDFRGDYGRHVEAMASLRRDFATRQSAILIGIYPDDPDAVGMENARWSLGVQLAEQEPGESLDAFLSRLERVQPDRRRIENQLLQPGRVAVLQSTIRNSRDDGLAMLRWLACSSYAQAGPTRMEYLDPTGGLDARVRIVVPISARTWEGPR